MRIFVLMILLFPALYLNGQGRSLMKDEILVQARSGIISKDLNAGIPDIGTYIKINSIEKIVGSLNIYKIGLSRDDNNGDMLEQFVKSPMVISAQYNGVTELRRTPNDREFEKQWALRKIQMPRAWDIGVGLNRGRAPIVVAILDSGIDRNHNDLKDNIWFNKDEIPNDGMDNDDNGYKDDYYGLNIQTNNDENYEHYHGTQVAGIIGAESNNTDGVAGINWHVQLMTIALAKTGSFQFDEIIEGMAYVLDQRKKYNESNGQRGAYVTVLNFSLGDLGWFEPSFQVICNLFTELGEAGILTVAATDNSDSNIDVLGDLPCDCKSDYLVAVTNSDQSDNKVQAAGYGVIGIDLAAPGESILSTSINKTFKSGSGCSFAAPMVSGAISLLYSLECEEFQKAIVANPASAALNIKSAILEGVDRIDQLESLVLSKGRLNVINSIESIHQSYCIDKLPKSLEIVSISPNPTRSSVRLEIKIQVDKEHVIQVINSIGQLVFEEKIPPDLVRSKIIFLDTKDLMCGSYYIRLSNNDSNVSKQLIICN